MSCRPELIFTVVRPAGNEAWVASTVPDFTCRVAKPAITLSAVSTTVSWASAKSKASVSPVAVSSLVTSFRVLCPAVPTPAMSATFSTTLSLSAARLP